LLTIAGAWIDDWFPSRGILTFANGSEARLFSGASPEMLRGPEHHIAWCDELSKWEKPRDTWDMLQFSMRLGEQPQVLVTTTPKPGPVLRRILDAKGTILTRGSTRQNPHLPDAYVETVEDLYGGTRLGRQEIEGELLSDTPGALWTPELLERCRISPAQAPLGEETPASPSASIRPWAAAPAASSPARAMPTGSAMSLPITASPRPAPKDGRGRWRAPRGSTPFPAPARR
jgi:phage terminase large subunit-like protein